MDITPDEFFQVGGTLSDDAPSYIERPADGLILDLLSRNELCMVLAPRQTGKSSLMIHARKLLLERGSKVGIVDFQSLGSQTDVEQWFCDVLYQIERSLRLDTDATEWWEENDRIGPTQRFQTFLEDVVLEECTGNVVVFFDEIDSILGLEFSDDFFTSVRTLHNARSNRPRLERLSFVFLGLATASSFIKNLKRTPFNVGTSIRLADFDRNATQPFQDVLGSDSGPLIDRIFHWTHGQPWLVQRLAATAATWPVEEQSPKRMDEEVRTSFLETKIENDTHLKFIRDYLLDEMVSNRKVLDTYVRVLKGQKVAAVVDSPEQERLKLAGVVRIEDERLVPRNRIYQSIFNLNWVKANTEAPSNQYKKVAWGASGLLVLALSWIFVIQPGFLPFLYYDQKDNPPILEYTAEPSVIIRHAIGDAVVDHVIIADTEVPVDNQDVKWTFSDLTTGPNQREMTLVGGFLNQQRTVPIEIVYHPRWEMQAYPASRHSKSVFAVAFSPPDGKTVVSASNDTTLKLWDADTGAAIRVLRGHAGGVLCAAFSPDGTRVVSGSRDDTLKLWNVETGKEIRTFKGHEHRVQAVDFSPKGNRFVSASADNTLKLWEASNNKSIRTFEGHTDDVLAVAFSPKGSRFVSASADNTLKLWEASRNEPLRTFEGHTTAVQDVLYTDDRRRIISAGRDGTVNIWNVDGGAPVPLSDNGFKVSVRDLSLSSDGRFLAVSGKEGVEIWDWETKTGIGRLDAPFHQVADIDFAPLTNTLASASEEGILRLWDIDGMQKLLTFVGHTQAVTDFAVAKVRQVLASAGKHGQVLIWDLEGKTLVDEIRDQECQVIGVEFARAGSDLVIACREGTIRIQSLEYEKDEDGSLVISRGPVRQLSGQAKGLSDLSISPDGSTVVAASDDGRLVRWEYSSGRPLAAWEREHDDRISRLEFTPDGRRIISVSFDRSLTVWDNTTGEPNRWLKIHSEIVTDLAVLKDGKLVTSSWDGRILLWDIRGGGKKPEKEFIGHTTGVTSIDISADGRKLISADSEGLVKLWDMETETNVRTFLGHEGKVLRVAFLKDGNQAVSGGDDKMIRRWFTGLETDPRPSD